MTYVEIKYTVLQADPPHMNGVMFKGLKLVSGSTHTVSPELAGHAQFSFDKRIEVLSGTPVAWSPGTASAKKAIRLASERARDFHLDPAAALSGLQPMPPAVVKALGAKDPDVIKALEEGAADAQLANVAIWAQLGGRTDVAAAAVRRAEALRLKG